jgi:peptidoglycan hydrolase-like protein with peptidoglycan-binding domain
MAVRRIRTIAVAGVVALGATAAAGWVGGLFGSSDAAAPASTTAALATVEVRRGDLVETRGVAGQLGYGATSNLVARGSGTVTALAAEGSTVRRGEPLYAVDGRPVTLLIGLVPMYRQLKPGDSGADVAQLEQNLHALGYTGFSVDDEYTSTTAAAVKRWQGDRGLDKTGEVGPAQVVFAGDAVRVAGHALQVGAPVGPGAPVLTLSPTRQVVSIDLDVADRRLVAVDAPVTVDLPGGTTIKGHIASIGAVAKAAGGKEGDASNNNATVAVVVAIDDGQSTGQLDAAPVKVNLESGRVKNVLSVPVVALLSTDPDQYAVELIDGADRRLVPVKIGAFASGRVQIEGAGIAEGSLVGVPRS